MERGILQLLAALSSSPHPHPTRPKRKEASDWTFDRISPWLLAAGG